MGHAWLWHLDQLASDSTVARRLAEQAVALAPGDPVAQRAMGIYHELVQIDHPKALAAYEAGLKAAPNDAHLLGDVAHLDMAAGRWDEALALATKAQAFDPRSGDAASLLASILQEIRRYPQALRMFGHARALAPNDLGLIEAHAEVYLAQGDLAGARAVFTQATKDVDSTQLASYVANWGDLFWVIDSAQQERVLQLPPTHPSFSGNRGGWATVHAEIYHQRGDHVRAQAWADSARRAYSEDLRSRPAQAVDYALRGLARAYLGDKAAAIKDGETGLALALEAREPYRVEYIRYVLARLYVLVGAGDKALDQLNTLVTAPSQYSRAWFRIDPNFAPLYGNPRFERLVSGN